MISTGIVRKVNELGRIVLPMEVRKAIDIVENAWVQFYIDGEEIILKKHETGCAFCGKTGNITGYKGKLVCRGCIEGLEN